MENITIFTDSCADLPATEKEIKVLPLYYYFDDEGIEYGDQIKLTMNEFYNKIKMGQVPRTASVNVERAIEMFESELQKDNNIICVSMSSALSSSYNNAFMAAKTLSEKYPTKRITVIDSLTASLGEGLIAIKALKMKNEGCKYEDIVNYIEKNRQYYMVDFFVDDLNFLVKGGRISKTAATVGQILNIKPLLHINEEGKIIVVEKVRGIKKLEATLIDRMVSIIDSDYDCIGIAGSDSLEGVKRLTDKINSMGLTNNYVFSEIGPIIASHVGSGSYGLIYKMKHK